jgi:hypothetical protein
MLMTFLLPEGGGPTMVREVERTIEVAAAPERAWTHLLDAPAIDSDEVRSAWIYRIGVPEPLGAKTTQMPGGQLVRSLEMGKAIHVQQIASQWKQNEFVRWTYVFTADSIPPKALDDHLMIGGRYFDLLGTDYTLQQLPNGNTALSIRMKYRVSTQFNWYVGYVAEVLMTNFEAAILKCYKQRAEQRSGQRVAAAV